MLDELSSTVADLMSAACDQLVLPRFRRLASEDIETKSGPSDFVTVADREAELFLTPRLQELVAGEVIGEEACAADPHLRARADMPVAWTVDPVDGTGNFVAGDERFCCMVALMHHGVPVRSWILFPLQRRLFAAVSGQGAFVRDEGGDPQRLEIPARNWSLDDLAGSANLGALDGARRDEVRQKLRTLPGLWYPKCTGFLGAEIAAGRQQFLLHTRCTPWDHAPVDLLCREAGGHAAMLDDMAPFNGRYASSLLIAPDRASWQTLYDHVWD